ncbi:MAG: NADH-quinone oxidoreductase subunit J [Methermicoccaceae archaeon]
MHELTREHVKRAVFWLLNLYAALILLLALFVGIVVNTQWYASVAQPVYTGTAESGIVDLGRELFTTYVASFELLSLLLLAALIGAIYLSKKDMESEAQ